MESQIPEESARGVRSEGSGDSLLAKLSAAQEEYRSLRSFWERRLRDLAEANSDLMLRAQDLEGELREAEQLADVRGRQAEHERRKAERQREHGRHISAALLDAYRRALGGAPHDALLDAALAVTGTNRGLLLLRDEEWRICAAADFPSTDTALLPSVSALCEFLWQSGQNCLVEGQGGEAADLAPDLAHWAVVRLGVGPRRGALLVAERSGRELDEEDLEALECVAQHGTLVLEHLEQQRDLRRTYVSTVMMLADAVEMRDSYPRGHTGFVLRYSRLVAERLGLSATERQVVSWVAMLHDVGKVGISDGVLHRPGPLFPQELEFVRSHTRLGADLVGSIPALQEVARGVRHHHEHWDGRGYPDGLRHEEIPISARIVSVVDGYQALVSRRSYRDSMTPEAAREELTRAAGSQFDPQVVEAFLSALEAVPAAADEDLSESEEVVVEE